MQSEDLAGLIARGEGQRLKQERREIERELNHDMGELYDARHLGSFWPS